MAQRRFGLAALWSLLRVSDPSHRRILIGTLNLSEPIQNAVGKRDLNDRPMTNGEIIGWYLRNGFTILQIRVMFPGFFLDSPVWEDRWEAADWSRQWDGVDEGGEGLHSVPDYTFTD